MRRRLLSMEAFLAVCVVTLATGIVFHLASQPALGDAVWASANALALVPSIFWVVKSLRARQPGVDIIAVLALAGTLATHEYLAGCVIGTMLASGRLLESRAQNRAKRDLTALLDRTPRVAHRRVSQEFEDVAVDELAKGDFIMVRPGEVVPVDGRVETRAAVLDESMLTGEALPVEHQPGDAVRSGSVNTTSPMYLLVTRKASDSTYAGIVRLVEAAQAEGAPFIRMADRYAVAFVPLTLLVAGLTWLLSGDAVRAVAVLVVATPCPLILAAPVAIVSGLSRSARRGVIIKGGDALERLADGNVLLFDKTGTLTEGHPSVVKVVSPFIDADEFQTLAASLDQVSPHVLASAIVRSAAERQLILTQPSDVTEVVGKGISGRVQQRDVAIGKAAWVAPNDSATWMHAIKSRADAEGSLAVFVAFDGKLAGAYILEDRIRLDAARAIRELHATGMKRIILVTGDRPEVGELVGAALDIDEVYADRSPAEKVDVVKAAKVYGNTIMVGDGVNDAPALATAYVGVAIGTQGASASSQTADVVLTVGRLDRLAEVINISRRSRRIATESVAVGMGLSLLAMSAAAFGMLTPTAGALIQEAIDVAAILNSLRALAGGERRFRLTGEEAVLSERFAADHQRLRPGLDSLQSAARLLSGDDVEAGLLQARHAHAYLVDEVLPHEEAEHSELYPRLARALGSRDSTGPMMRAHVEIRHLAHRLGRLLDDMPAGHLGSDDVSQLQQVLYGLHAILSLHFQQEEESYFSLADDQSPSRTATNATSSSGSDGSIRMSSSSHR